MSERPDFDAGDLVVCVDVSVVFTRNGKLGVGGHMLRLGAIYRVEGIAFNPKSQEPDAVLAEVAGPSETGGFHFSRFRKIDRADDSFTAWMQSLRPVPATQPVEGLE